MLKTKWQLQAMLAVCRDRCLHFSEIFIFHTWGLL
jgi:hypothetical protein